MTLRFIPCEYKSGRIVAKSGTVDVGAIFPVLSQPSTKWRWSMWIEAGYCEKHGEAYTELDAKNALLTAWQDFLRAAGLQQIEEADHG